MLMHYVLIAVILLIAIYLYHTREKFYFEPSQIMYGYDPEVALDSGMLYGPAAAQLYE